MPAAPLQSQPTPAAASRRGSRRRRRRRHDDESTGALQIAEEAFHLLRTTPLASLWLYYLGTIPCALAAFYFWADMSRSSHAAGDAALASAGLAVAYFWMKGWQGLFCRGLWEQLHPSGRPLRLSRGRFLRHLAAQMLIHAFALPVRLISLVFLVWTLPFFQNATVLAFTQDFGRQPLRRTVSLAASLAHQRWGQSCLILLLMLAIGLFVWVNVLGTLVIIPQALKMFFGMETIFTLNLRSAIMNTTFLFGSLLAVFLVMDPMMKAIQTIRCFQGVSRPTGADLLSRLAQARTLAATGVAGLFLLAAPVSGQEAPPAPLENASPAPVEDAAPASADELRRSIEETLRKKAYQWRFPRQEPVVETDEEKNWLELLLGELAASIGQSVERFNEWLDRTLRRLFEGDQSKKRREPVTMPGAGFGAGIGLIGKLLLVTAVALLIAWVAVLIVRRARREKPAAVDDAGAAGPVDLESETIVATQLPEDEWMRLAREQIAKGEHRLAVRALFLASLAHLGDRGLLHIARYKSNRDYTRELLLKARAQPDLRSAFGENVGLFERVWYGLHEIGREAIERFTANYERISRPAVPPADPVAPPRP